MTILALILGLFVAIMISASIISRYFWKNNPDYLPGSDHADINLSLAEQQLNFQLKIDEMVDKLKKYSDENQQ